MDHRETIVAIATPLSSAGIGIIRISGNESIAIADSVFKGKKSLAESDSHTVNYGHIFDGDKVIDEVLVILLKAPRSYTTEDTVEINCHGGMYIMEKIVHLLVEKGARIAEPGEFTKRAFLNGRIDLSQAESVMDLISSKSEASLRNSLNQLSGSVKRKVVELREKIIYQVAYIETALDDPEHYDLSNYPDEIKDISQNLLIEINKMIASFNRGSILKEGIKTAIVGKPNAGKSSVLNILSNSDRAIVTDIPGTTRDTLEQQIVLGEVILNLIDTAGIRETQDTVEAIGVERSIKAIDDADLILYVVDSSSPLTREDDEIIEKLQNKKTVVLFNKNDLVACISDTDILSRLDAKIISFSAKEGSGIEELKIVIEKMFFGGEFENAGEDFISNLRHKNLLEEAANSLSNVIASAEAFMPEDFYSIDLMDAYTSLGFIIGESLEDDLVNEIFSKFCMGK